MEVIVVLVITSLIVTILMQGLSVVLGTKLKFGRTLSSVEAQGLQMNVIKTPIQGLMPDYHDGPEKFVGAERRLTGLTIYPLQGVTGAPTKITFSLDYDISENVTTLSYSELGYDTVSLAEWPGNIGRFYYRGRLGDWTPRWPPPGDEFLQAPRTVRIETGLEVQSNLFVQVIGPHERPVRVQDTPLGPSL